MMRFRAQPQRPLPPPDDDGFRLALGSNAADLDDRPYRAAFIPHPTRGERNWIEMPIAMDEHGFALSTRVRRRGAIDRAIANRKRGSIRVAMVNELVERRPGNVLQAEARQDLGRVIHVNAVLPLIHGEERHGRVVTECGELAEGLFWTRQRLKGSGGYGCALT